MLRHAWFWAISMFMAAHSVGCGDEVRVHPNDDDEGGGGGGAETGSGGNAADGKQPPSPVEGAPAGDGPGHVLAIDSLDLGENGSDWRSLGYDLDGRISDGSDVTLCRPFGGSNPKMVHADGDAGIDNAFGNNLLAIVTTLIMSPSTEVNAQIAAGTSTILFDLANLGPQPSYVGIDGYLNFGLTLGGPAAFDGTDTWPIDASLLGNASDSRTTKYHVATSYVSDHTWVSGEVDAFEVRLPLLEAPLVLPLDDAVITMRLAGDRLGADQGIIAGIMPVEALIAEFVKVAGSFDPILCEGPTIENISDQIRQVADMPSSGIHDPNQVCDAISVGLGFTARVVQIGSALVPPPALNPCGP